MKPLSGAEIYGNWGTLLLPINDNESIDYEKLKREIDNLIVSGVNGIYSNGTAGEFYNITEEEFDKLSAILAEKCDRANMPFQIGVSHMSPIISLNRLKRSLKYYPGAFQVILPDWFTVTNPEAIDFLKLMADTAGEIGLVLYNPPHAKRILTPEDFELLKNEIHNLVGIKVAGGNKDWYDVMKKHSIGLSVFIPGHNIITGCLQGAHGAYSNIACLNPFQAQKWYTNMIKDTNGALDIERRINEFLSGYIIPLITQKHYSNQAVDKCLASIGGWTDIGTKLRWPYKSIPEDYAISLRIPAREIIPEFF